MICHALSGMQLLRAKKRHKYTPRAFQVALVAENPPAKGGDVRDML